MDEVITVGQALAILCQDFQTQVANRRYFYRSGRLMTNGIISLIRSRWHQGSGDLTDNRIVLDRRVLDWAVGLDSEINELVEGSDLYEPKANLAQVVLPHGYLDALLKQCLCYDAFRKYRNDIGMQDTLSYGNSLVVMLCGKSGTGKTMTVNAIAKGAYIDPSPNYDPHFIIFAPLATICRLCVYIQSLGRKCSSWTSLASRESAPSRAAATWRLTCEGCSGRRSCLMR